MALIRNGAVSEDRWQVVAADAADIPSGEVILPLAAWQKTRRQHADRATSIGVWLEPSDDPSSLVEDLDQIPLIAVNFPKFTDGRGFSTARLLRDRYGYRGEIRAVGDVLRDQLFYMKRCGFDAFRLRADQDPDVALRAFGDFDEYYQGATDQPLPLFRRRAAAAAVPSRPADALDQRVEALRALLRRIERDYQPAALATAFGIESMVLIDLIAKEFRGIQVFTLDTGRLPAETYQLMHEVRRRYDLHIDIHAPDPAALARYVREHGANGFYDGVEQRLACCQVRKLEPMSRALAGKRAWLSGLRRDQAETRRDAALEEWDEKNAVVKFNPLVDWSESEVWAYIRRHEVPYNELLDRGYASIGCAPCTRAIKPGESARAGRWWWESGANKECGLHLPSKPRAAVQFAPRQQAIQLSLAGG
jgi:phosphoadenosine phosphosulfate reductase